MALRKYKRFFIVMGFLLLFWATFEAGILKGLIPKLIKNIKMKKFDYKNYWEKRYATDILDIRTVGFKSFPEKANRVSYLLIE